MKGSVEFIGFWQNERYFLEHKEKLREIFTPVNINLDAKELSDVIRCTNSVSVHIRRGDYVSNVDALKVHGLCTERYYIDSIRYLKEGLMTWFFLYLVMISNGVRNIKMKYFQGVMM